MPHEHPGNGRSGPADWVLTWTMWRNDNRGDTRTFTMTIPAVDDDAAMDALHAMAAAVAEASGDVWDGPDELEVEPAVPS